MMTNAWHHVLYIGVSSELPARVAKHRQHFYKGSFTDKYNAEKLVWYELHDTIESAIEREKQLKRWTRKKKEALIQVLNPEWKDLYDAIVG